MRLFVAVLPPAGVAAELNAALAPLHALPGADGLRWSDPAGWHLTLAFLGRVGEGLRPELDERLERAARRHPPLSLALADGGRFGDRALWAGVGDGDGGRKALCRLAGSAAAAARRTGIPVDERPFRAHLTVARSRTAHRREGGAAAVGLRPFAEALAGFESSAWTADRLRLMSSTPGPVGRPPRYATVRSWPLGRG